MARILIADDDKVFGIMLREVLELEGFTVDVAESGQSALRKLMAEQPDLLLLDMKMPTISGQEILRWVNKNPDYRKMKIVVVTGFQEAQNSSEAELIDAFLTKPVAIQLVLDCIHELLSEQV